MIQKEKLVGKRGKTKGVKNKMKKVGCRRKEGRKKVLKSGQNLPALLRR
jgi:hypothetical protein